MDNASNDKTQPVKSSLIAGYSYDPATLVLTVNFRSDPNTDHIYRGVPPFVVSQVFDTSQSVGKAFRRLISLNKAYKYHKDS